MKWSVQVPWGENGAMITVNIDTDKCKGCKYWKTISGYGAQTEAKCCVKYCYTDVRRVILPDGSCGSYEK